MQYLNNETICALATPTGGALAIIRISGRKTFAIVSSICSVCCEKVAANSMHYTHIKDEEDVIDEVMLSVFRSPHSYTGEDSVEINCHGSAYIAKKILELLITKGCRMAEPGEFTMRAYMNGKMDLSQAEAVADIIASTNAASHKLAMNQLRGQLSTKLSELRKQLLHLTTLLELELDFSDHEDLEFADRTELLSLANTIEQHISILVDSYKRGQALKNGINVAIIGRTNVGKSTLLNKLVKDDKAIVSDIHGTTRDTIEDVIELGGVAFRFVDTAGLRTTDDKIERIGIERTYKAIEKAQIIIWITNDVNHETEEQKSACSVISSEEDKKVFEMLNGSDIKLIKVVNKADLTNQEIGLYNDTLYISAKYDKGIDILEKELIKSANISALHENDIIVTSARHYAALCSALEHLHRVIDGMNINISGDLIAEDLRMILNDLSEITGGTITSQETLNNIFNHFCVGK